jgi:hypothetical protein
VSSPRYSRIRVRLTICAQQLTDTCQASQALWVLASSEPVVLRVRNHRKFHRVSRAESVIDLISYQNDRKDRTTLTGRVWKVVSKYSSPCIYLRADEVLIFGRSGRRLTRLCA